MKRLFHLIIILSVSLHLCGAVTPRCGVRFFDEEDGLSQRSVKQIAVDRDGLVWIATWNGLNRFDGYDFAVIRPAPGDSARRYSSRYRDIKPAADGRLWCRIDDRLVRLDPSTYRFEDVHTAIEERLGRRLPVKSWRQTAGYDTVVARTDAGWLIVPDNNPVEGAWLTDSEPQMRYASFSNRKLGDFGPYTYQQQAYCREDGDGHVWTVTRDGIVAFAENRASEPREVIDLGVADGSLRFCTPDTQGGLWFCSSRGALRLSPGVLPYTPLPGGEGHRIIASARDSLGRVWVSEPDRKAVAVYDASLSGTPKYLSPTGRLSDSFVSWGHAVYSLAVSPDGTVWAGAKPDGLTRLTPAGDDRYEVRGICGGNIYDIVPDRLGRLHIATLGDGMKTILNPCSDSPETVTYASYPPDALGCRRLALAGDTMIYAATTGGLVEMRRNLPARLHVTEAGRLSSLGCIAVTDAVVTPTGLFVSTESDGVSGMHAPGEFISYDDPVSNRLDVAMALTAMPLGRLLAVGPGHLYTIDPEVPGGDPQVFGEGYWGRRMRFTDMRPLRLADGRWLLGTAEGGIAASLAPDAPADTACRVIFTSASIQGGRDTLLTATTSYLTLGESERSLTLRFAAPEYSWPGELRYSVSIDGGEWSAPSTSRSITLYDLAPGSYDIDVTVTDHIGRPSAYARRLTLTVTPRWYETIWARAIFVLLILSAVGGAVWTVMYIRAIRRKQRETLEAYLRLMEQQNAPHNEEAPAPEPTPAPAVSEADNGFMQRVMEYVNTSLADPEADVDGMAAAIGMSRSNLTRKMRALMGVSPADFMRQTRMARAATLLRTTDMAVKEIAYDCGFSDLNYFGKCFKATHGVTPTAYRRG